MCIYHLDGAHLGSDMILFGSDQILLGSKVQEISVLLVAVLINFGVKNQVLQVSLKIVDVDLMSFHTFGSDMNLFGYDMILFGYDMILFGSNFTFSHSCSCSHQFWCEKSSTAVLLQFCSWDFVLVSSYEFDDILFCE